jgi:hypothetical protein
VALCVGCLLAVEKGGRAWAESRSAMPTPSPVFCKNVIGWGLVVEVCKRCDSKGDRDKESWQV